MNNKLFNKNQVDLIGYVLQQYNLVPCHNDTAGFMPKKLFSFLGYDDWDKQIWMDIPIISKNNYIHWFSIFDEYENIAQIHFYYPLNVSENKEINILISMTGFPLLKIHWIHEQLDLVKNKLMYLFYATFCNRHIQETNNKSLKKCFEITGVTNV